MIILTDSSGQLCNRILIAAHAYATGLETEQKVCTLFCTDFRKKFAPVYPKSRFMFLPVSHEWLTFHNKVMVKIFGQKYWQWSIRRRPEQEQKRKSIYAGGGLHKIDSWFYRDYEAFFRHEDNIRKLFTPALQYVSQVEKFTRLHGFGQQMTVGVHIRRGDYRVWENGRFYYEDAQYKTWMEQLAEKSTERIQFLLCSNEPIDLEAYRNDGLYDVITGPGETMTDLLALSCCSYIMGPPSTYSWWAAFYGSKPYLTLHSVDQKIAADNFAPVKGEEFNPEQYG